MPLEIFTAPAAAADSRKNYRHHGNDFKVLGLGDARLGRQLIQNGKT
jgi:hypothetical protein